MVIVQEDSAATAGLGQTSRVFPELKQEVVPLNKGCMKPLRLFMTSDSACAPGNKLYSLSIHPSDQAPSLPPPCLSSRLHTFIYLSIHFPWSDPWNQSQMSARL